MKKIPVILFFFCFSFSNIYSQQFGNEWIDYSKQYFKMPISDTGIHRLDYITIRAALFGIGVQVTSIPTSQFQVFGREKEVPLYIEDGGDGFLNSGDYIEFFAEINLLGVLSSCPGGDCGSEHSSDKAKCYPLKVTIFSTLQKNLKGWTSPPVSSYNKKHGL